MRKKISAESGPVYVMPTMKSSTKNWQEHVTLRMLWEEYVERCIHTGQRYYMETQYRRYYHQYARTQKATIRLEHKPHGCPGRSGSHIAYYDEDMGELNEAHLCCGLAQVNSSLRTFFVTRNVADCRAQSRFRTSAEHLKHLCPTISRQESTKQSSLSLSSIALTRNWLSTTAPLSCPRVCENPKTRGPSKTRSKSLHSVS